MKILVVSQYFWPETFRINDLCIGLIERGHDVTVLTGIPNYPKGEFYSGYNIFKKRNEKWNGITIHRSILFPRKKSTAIDLAINYLSFPFFACFNLLFIKGKFDKIFVMQLSPVTSAIPAIVAKKMYKAPLYFWVQDLWPMSLVDAGNVKNKTIISFFDKLTRYLYKKSDNILIQSKGFANYIKAQGVEDNKLLYFPNSAESFYKSVEVPNKYSHLFPDGFNLLFAGNIGQAQSFKTLIEAAYKVKQLELNVNWIILGDGRMKEEATEKVAKLNLTNNFFFLGSFPATVMPEFFANADALIVSLKESEIFGLTIPSKIQSYLACAKPIIGSLNGTGSDIIQEAKAGFVAPAENASFLADIIVKMYHLPLSERNQMGENGKLYFEKEFEREILLDRLETYFK